MIVTGIIILGIAVYSICVVRKIYKTVRMVRVVAVVPGVPEKIIAVNHSGALA